MTALEEYKLKVDTLRARLDNVSADYTNEVLGLMREASNKLEEMMLIITNIGIANGAMAMALQVMQIN